MKHYFYPGRSYTTQWMLRELDAPHEEVFVDFPAGESVSPEFRAINPMCKVPALVDGDTVVTEVAAICAYLADKLPEKGFAPSPGSTERGVKARTWTQRGCDSPATHGIRCSNLTDFREVSPRWTRGRFPPPPAITARVLAASRIGQIGATQGRFTRCR